MVFFCVQRFDARGSSPYVDIGGIVDYHCKTFLNSLVLSKGK